MGRYEGTNVFLGRGSAELSHTPGRSDDTAGAAPGLSLNKCLVQSLLCTPGTETKTEDGRLTQPAPGSLNVRFADERQGSDYLTRGGLISVRQRLS